MDTHDEKPLVEKLLKKNILVLDDEGMITKTLCTLLKDAGYYADASQNGFDAIEKTEDEEFDLIIADIRMPDIDGIETVKKMRETSRMKHKPDTPVIFITGYPDSPSVLEAKRLGDVLFKPFDTKKFLTLVAKHIKE